MDPNKIINTRALVCRPSVRRLETITGAVAADAPPMIYDRETFVVIYHFRFISYTVHATCAPSTKADCVVGYDIFISAAESSAQMLFAADKGHATPYERSGRKKRGHFRRGGRGSLQNGGVPDEPKRNPSNRWCPNSLLPEYPKNHPISTHTLFLSVYRPRQRIDYLSGELETQIFT